MEVFYQGTYRDEYGEEAIVIHNDGQEMRTTIRGVELVTYWFFDEIETPNLIEPRPLMALLGNSTEKWWTLSCNFPVTVVTEESELQANLEVELIVGISNSASRFSRSGQNMVLKVRGQYYHRQTRDEYFDDGLREIQQFLPEGWYIKTCVNCNWGEIQPGGGPGFGGMGCFRNNRERLLWARSFSYQKPYLFQIWKEKTEWVQETHLCEDFELPIPGNGYQR